MSTTNKTALGIKVLAVLLAAVLVYLWRPLFHGVIYRIAYSPGGLIVFGLTLVVGLFLFLSPPLKDTSADSSAEAKATMLGIVFVIALILAFLYGVPASWAEEETLAERTMDRAEQVDEFPAVNTDNPRIVPRAVADTQTRGSVSYRQHELGTSDIARMEDGRLAWSYSIQPDPFMVKLRGNQRGVLLSDMTRMEDREMQAYDDQEFVHGQAMFAHRSADWHLKKSDFWAQYRDDPIEFVHDGQAYMAYPKTGHEWRLGPIPHTVPVWKGVALVHTDGTIEHLSPEEARQSEILDGQRLYPLYNARREASSLRYRNGIVNQMPLIGSYQGVIEVADMPGGAGNSQPFVIDLEGENMNYVMAMEPHGESSRGLDEVWFFDADTGQPRYYATGGDTLLGPERAMGIIRSEDSQTEWVVGDEEAESGFQVVEPVPVTIDDELWWHAKVVPLDQTDVTRNAFVNAHTGNAVELHSTEAVREFMAGENVTGIDDAANATTEPANDTEGVAYYVVVTDEDGNVIERIPVQEGQEVRIEQSANSTEGS